MALTVERAARLSHQRGAPTPATLATPHAGPASGPAPAPDSTAPGPPRSRRPASGRSLPRASLSRGRAHAR
jgi:hypothetical protein